MLHHLTYTLFCFFELILLTSSLYLVWLLHLMPKKCNASFQMWCCCIYNFLFALSLKLSLYTPFFSPVLKFSLTSTLSSLLFFYKLFKRFLITQAWITRHWASSYLYIFNFLESILEMPLLYLVFLLHLWPVL
jgi:hypothetical protein